MQNNTFHLSEFLDEPVILQDLKEDILARFTCYVSVDTTSIPVQGPLKTKNKVLRTVLLLTAWLGCAGLGAQSPLPTKGQWPAALEVLATEDLEAGDLLFQEWACGPLCSDIGRVTQSAYGRQFTHCGLLVQDSPGTWKVLEALGQGVVLVPLDRFLARTQEATSGYLIGRSADPSVLPGAIPLALSQIGKAYDHAFQWGDDKWYCSELLEWAFAKAAGTEDYFGLQPMTYKDPTTSRMLPTWEQYFATQGIPVPEGMPGINPGSLSRSPRLKHFLWKPLSPTVPAPESGTKD